MITRTMADSCSLSLSFRFLRCSLCAVQALSSRQRDDLISEIISAFDIADFQLIMRTLVSSSHILEFEQIQKHMQRFLSQVVEKVSTQKTPQSPIFDTQRRRSTDKQSRVRRITLLDQRELHGPACMRSGELAMLGEREERKAHAETVTSFWILDTVLVYSTAQVQSQSAVCVHTLDIQSSAKTLLRASPALGLCGRTHERHSHVKDRCIAGSDMQIPRCARRRGMALPASLCLTPPSRQRAAVSKMATTKYFVLISLQVPDGNVGATVLRVGLSVGAGLGTLKSILYYSGCK